MNSKDIKMSSEELEVVEPRPRVSLNDLSPASVEFDSSKSATNCPWANVVQPALQQNATTLNDIMSEQLAGDLQFEEEREFLKELLKSEDPDVKISELMDVPTNSDDCSSDQVIAQMLQMQFNREYDDQIKRVEQKFNGSSKVSVSLSNYMVSPVDDDSDSDEEINYNQKSWDSFEAYQKSFPAMSKAGYVRVNNEVVTKHDMTMSGRRNACRVMEFPPGISTGDGASFDMQLSNKVFNTLKVYSKAEEGRRTRVHDKIDKSTSEMAIDAKTRLLLYKLVNNNILDKVYGIISTGKEAVVLYASGGSLSDETEVVTEIPAECVVKNPRKIIHLWAEKEMHNLNRMNKVGIPCPSVVVLKKHMLVMSFIGKDGQAAPMLKEVKFSQDSEEDMQLLQSAYNQVIESMHKLYKQCSLIHGDLSEYNILWHENKCYFIDVSQSVEPCHPHGLEFLYRDCTNVCNYFAKKGAKDVITPESLFFDISGFKLDGSGAEILNQVRDYEKNLELLTFAKTEKPYPFEYCWEKSQK
ncbi:unnamed protein product [Allacma fusca]|uniref:Serine/threonine-protein kinase RIO3 n=1 Tax=Allacma fusca TaxID=39272 RepID=A0A8J2PUT8_9HEXA|nr:unnamed protein product [Allacma fusca]